MLIELCDSPARTTGSVAAVDSLGSCLEHRKVTTGILDLNACYLVLIEHLAVKSRGFAHS